MAIIPVLIALVGRAEHVPLLAYCTQGARRHFSSKGLWSLIQDPGGQNLHLSRLP